MVPDSTNLLDPFKHCIYPDPKFLIPILGNSLRIPFHFKPIPNPSLILTLIKMVGHPESLPNTQEVERA